MITYSTSDRPDPTEYVDFLRRSDLGSEYPRAAFEERIKRLLSQADVCITAHSDDARLVGVCLGLTDFAYFLFLTDLGVDRDFTRRGIGRALVKLAHEAAGGPEDISMVTWTNRDAMRFYASCGMTRVDWAAAKHATNWNLFTVGVDDPP